MNLTKKSWYPIAFMFALTALVSSILIGFAGLTRGRVEANEKLAFEKAVLFALRPDLSPKTPNLELHELFVKSVQAPDDSSAGAYRRVEDGVLAGYAVKFEGRGFWDVIRGVIGVKPDRRSITGIAFYEQHETPGLGAEIVTPRFRDQFAKDKQLAESGPPLEFKPEHTARGPSEIDALTGATQTSTRLAQILDRRLAEWRDAMAKTGQGR